MLKDQRYLLLLLLTAVIGCKTPGEAPASLPTFSLEPLAEGLISPVQYIPALSGETALVVSQTGLVYQLRGSEVLDEPFIDLRTKVVPLDSTFSEMGLLGLALHPKYAQNNKFYAFYTHQMLDDGSGAWIRISAFQWSEDAEEVLSSEQVLMELEHPGLYVYGGQLAFGPDGFLYIGIGTSKPSNAQSMDNLFGKILRIDVDQTSDDRNYSIPPDNPFRSTAIPEAWALGMRNPYRFSFDKELGLIAVDVGTLVFEEVNIIERGRNYGWPKYEGTDLRSSSSFNSLLIENNTQPNTGFRHKRNATFGSAITGALMIDLPEDTVNDGEMIVADWNGDIYISRGGKGDRILKEVEISNLEQFSTAEQDTLVDDEGMLIMPRFKINAMSLGKDNRLILIAQKGTGPYDNMGGIYILTLEK